MGRLGRHSEVKIIRFTVKVKLNKQIKLSDTGVNIKENDMRFIFDKYGDNALSLELNNLYGDLSAKGFKKSLKGDFVIFIVKKVVKGKWRKLHDEQMSVVKMSPSGVGFNYKEPTSGIRQNGKKSMLDNWNESGSFRNVEAEINGFKKKTQRSSGK